jgi:DNA-directed RNA polymerase subunit alpha
LEESLHELGLPVRIINALETGANVYTVKELLQLTPAQVLALPNFGQKTLNTIHEALASFGFYVRSQQNENAGSSDASADTENRRRRIRDALGGSAVDDWDAEILLYGNARARKRRPKRTTGSSGNSKSK